MRILDFHAHLNGKNSDAVAELLATMDSLEIECAVVVPGGSVTPEQLSHGISGALERNVSIDNATLFARAEESRGRLIPFFFGNPHESPEEYLRAPAARGLKLGPAVHGVPLGDPRNLIWIEAARKRGHLVYLHCLPKDGFDVPALLPLATRFADVTFVLGHAGVGNADFRAVALIEPHGNIHFETSGGFSSVIQFAVERLGAERVLFGTEYPLQDPALEALKVKRLGISEAGRARVLGGNAFALLGDSHAH